MSNLTGALEELRKERSRAQVQVEKLNQAILVIESLNGSGTSRNKSEPTRIVSLASRRKMAAAQKARWARAVKGAQPVAGEAKTTGSAPARRISPAGRRRIAAAQRARWAKLKAGQRSR